MKTVFRTFEREAAKYNGRNYNRIGTITTTFDCTKYNYPKDLWANTIWVPFEDMKVTVPERVDELLHYKFGDYMKPVKQVTNHGELLFSPNTPYEAFIEDNYDTLRAKWLKWYNG